MGVKVGGKKLVHCDGNLAGLSGAASGMGKLLCGFSLYDLKGVDFEEFDGNFIRVRVINLKEA